MAFLKKLNFTWEHQQREAWKLHPIKNGMPGFTELWNHFDVDTDRANICWVSFWEQNIRPKLICPPLTWPLILWPSTMGKPGSWKALPTFKPHSSPHFSPKIAFNGQTTCNLGFRPKKDQRTDFLFVEILELSLGLGKVFVT